MAINQQDKEELVLLLKEVITEIVEQHPLTDEEVEWVRLAIKSEAKRAAFRQAVIEKTFLGVVSAGFLWIISKFIEIFLSHWK